jgi:inosine-uridine nucleoside N-ribohydrolase
MEDLKCENKLVFLMGGYFKYPGEATATAQWENCTWEELAKCRLTR